MNASPIHLASIYKSDPSVKITYNEAYTHGQYEGYDGTVAANIGGGDPVMLLGKLAKESSKLTFCTNQGVDKVFKDYMKEHFGEAFANRLSTENFMKYLERVYGSYYFYYVNDKTHKESLRYTRFENDLEKIHQDFESGNLAGDSTSVVAPTEGGVVCKHRNWLPSITKLMVHLGDIVKFDKAFKGNKSLTDFILDTINKKCPAAERISKVGNLPQPIHAKEESNGNKDALKRFISQHLCQSKQPLAIQACSKGFVSPPGSNNPKCSLYCGEGVAQPCIGTDHIMAIVGRRLVGGVTQYLIQNSWGSTCGNYPISVECNASDNGRFWVKEEDLLKQITTAVGMRNDLNSVLQ